MAAISERFDLAPDEFAFHFEASGGVDADALANFLKRAATVARQQRAELRIVGLREGSLFVMIKAVRKGAAKEFAEKPIDTSIKVSTFVVGVVGAIVVAMTPAKSGNTPLGKAGAEVVERYHVTQITLVTNETRTVVMNPAIAAAVREAEQGHGIMLQGPEAPLRLRHGVAEMIEDARRGDLTGDAAVVDGYIHFRPDGYRFWVPIDANPAGPGGLRHGGRFRVAGHIETRDGQPDRIVVEWAEPAN